MSFDSGYQILGLPTDFLSDGSGAALAFGMSLASVLIITPRLIRKMHAGGMVGNDVNKATKVQVAELGGIAALFAFSVSLSLVVGFQKLLGNVAEPPVLAAISVFFMASMIGLIDDISNLKQRFKALVVSFAALPLMLVHIGPEIVDLPFGYQIDFTAGLHLFYWLILVPIGVTGVANAMNMSAGYNGLESGQLVVVSFALLVIAYLRGAPDFAELVFACLLGSSLGLYYFNRYPARVFIGDIGTLGLGAALAAGAVLAHIEFYGLIVIAPAFYEASATLIYGLERKNGLRKQACQNPRILPNGRLAPPPGAERYTLAYRILAIRPLSEPKLVRRLLMLYAVSGGLAIVLSVV